MQSDKAPPPIDPEDIPEPGGLMACSPELMRKAEDYAGRKWDGTQADAERLIYAYLAGPLMPDGT